MAGLDDVRSTLKMELGSILSEREMGMDRIRTEAAEVAMDRMGMEAEVCMGPSDRRSELEEDPLPSSMREALACTHLATMQRKLALIRRMSGTKSTRSRNLSAVRNLTGLRWTMV